MDQENCVCCKCSKTIVSQYDMVLTAGIGDPKVFCTKCYESLSEVVVDVKKDIILKSILLNVVIRALIVSIDLVLIPFPISLLFLVAILANTFEYFHMMNSAHKSSTQGLSIWRHDISYHGGQKYNYKYSRTII